MKLKDIQNMIAEAIDTEKAIEKVVGDAKYSEWGLEFLEAAATRVKATKTADTAAQSVLRTCAEIAIGDRLGAFEKAPEEMRLGMEHARLREYVALLDPVNDPGDADRFEAIIDCIARHFGENEVETILFGEEVEVA